jgi:hypothetical protein
LSPGRQYLHADDQDLSQGIRNPAHCAKLSGALSSLPPRFLLSWATWLPISCPSVSGKRQLTAVAAGICVGEARGENISRVPANLCASMSPVLTVTSRLSAFGMHGE